MTKAKLKEKFKVFFQKNKNITKLPFIINIVIPKYESKGERVIEGFDEIINSTEVIDKYLILSLNYDVDSLYDKIIEDLPEISVRDSFYIFGENNLIVVEYKNEEVVFEVIDFEEEIWEMY